MAQVGPGANKQEATAPIARLAGATEYEYVTIHNPLLDDFVIQVAQTKPVDTPFKIRKDGVTSTISNTEQDVRNTYGLALKNPNHRSNAHILNTAVIKAGGTINLKGDEAQVAVRQLVNEIIQKEGRTRLLADPHVRKEIEDRVIVATGSVQDLMDNNLRPVREQIDEAVSKSNEVEDEFPGVKTQEGTGRTGELGDQSTPSEDRPSQSVPKLATN